MSPALAQTIDGTVFRDYNADGTQAMTGEPGVEGAIVTVFNDAGASCQQATDAAGDYTVDTTTCNGGGALVAGAAMEFRVEFTLPSGGSLDFLESAPAGGTTVQFVDVSGGDVSGVNSGLNAPPDYCEADPLLATTCFVDADRPNDQALVTFRESEVTDSPGGNNRGFDKIPPMAETAEAVQSEVGTVWGLAWQRSSQSLFSAAFVKFQPALGTDSLPDGPGAIYRTELGGGGSSVFVTIPNVGTHTGDRSEVGRNGLGDLEISQDESTLYTVNLSSKELVTIPLMGNPPTPGTVTTTTLPVPSASECAAANVHPFALGIYRDKLYVGMTCGAPAASLRAWVYEFASGTFTEKINLPFTYGRATTNTNYQPPVVTNNRHDWSDWDTYDPITPPTSFNDTFNARSQPWLTDIAFDNGDMILGIRSRRLDTAVLSNFVKGGDTLRACADSATSPTTWMMENNGSCGGVTPPVMATDPWTNSPNVLVNYLGPGGGEYYWNDDGWEGESTQGALLQIPGRAHLVVSQIDALGHINQQGVMRLNHTSGLITGAGNVFFGDNGSNIGKANGLGDLEALCQPAPLEIGNRIWCDANMDGVQDPGAAEAGVPGVDVVLDCGAAGSLTVPTDANGQYLFRDADFQIGNGTPIPRDANCTISIDLNSEGNTIGNACLGTLLPPIDMGANDLHDSDCSSLGGGLVGVDILTGASGENDHTYDCGFFGIPADYGDAPETYGTSAGPRHDLPPNATLYLGDCVDTEGSGQPVTTGTPADGDDLGAGLMTAGTCSVTNDDEDGVVFTTMIAACNMATVDVTCQGTGGQLDAWIDFNGDGDFADIGEQIFANTSLTCGGATDSLTFDVPCAAASGLSYARFRVSTAGGTTPTNTASDGEVEDYQVTVKGVDYGDAPDSYGTTQGASGPSHAVDPGSPLYLGACVDTEVDGQPVTAGSPANGDDLGAGLSDLGGCAGPDDEDGVVFDTMVTTCEDAQVTVTASQSGLLDAWIDFDGDGTFGAGEQVFTNQAVAGGANVLIFSVSCSATVQAVTYTRFRLSTVGGLGPQGPAMDGEVEDYDVPLKGLDFGDAPTPYPTLGGDDGARHVVPPTGNPTLGSLVDTEPEGQPNADHTGDDINGLDDEDGVVFSGALIPGIASSINVSTGIVGGRLDAWCDWNGDGNWTGAGEQIATSQTLAGGGATTLTPTVPANAVLGTTCCRFRLSSAGGLAPTGLAMDGEVEDYEAVIAPEDPSIGLAKEVISVTEVTPGVSYSVLLKLTVENFGNVKLNNVQVTSDLTTDFSEADSFVVSSINSTDLTVNPAFIGTGNLLAGTDMLIAGAMGMVEMEVLVEPGVNLGPYSCSSQATATSLAGTPVMDVSQAGNNGDPDGDGDPTDNDQPTAILFPGAQEIPTLGEWSLILLVLMLSTAAFRLLRRREQI